MERERGKEGRGEGGREGGVAKEVQEERENGGDSVCRRWSGERRGVEGER